MRHTLFATLGVLVTPLAALALNGPSGISYEGRLYDSSGNPSTQTVNFVVKVYNPSGSCLLKVEQTANIDLAPSNGYFTITIGQGTALSGDPGLSATQIFANQGPITGGSSCTYTPTAGEGRLLRIAVNDGTSVTAMTPDIPIGATPYALVADTVQGKAPTDFIQVNSSTASLTQAGLESIFSSTGNVSALQSLVSGTSSLYVRPGSSTSFSGSVSFSSPPMVSSPPTSGSQVANKLYCDGNIAGRPAASTLSGLSTPDTGKVLQWTGTQWDVMTPASTFATSVTMNGGLTVASNITGSSALTVAAGGVNQSLLLGSSGTGSVNMGSANGMGLSVLDGGTTVNYVTVKGSLTGMPPIIGVAGTDANIGIALLPKGTGSVGIGTTSPQGLLEMKSVTGVASTLNIASTDATGTFATSSIWLNVGDNGSNYWNIQNDSTGFLKFRNSTGSVKMMLNPSTSGGLSVNTTAALNTLDVAGGSAFGSYAGANMAPANGMIVSGNVGIGTSTPPQALSVLGKILIMGTNNGVGFPDGSSIGSGNHGVALFNSSGSWTVPSGVTSAKVIIAGGGGGGCNSMGNGGSGGVGYGFVNGLTPGASIAISVGSGGTFGTNGASGTNSSFGSTMISATGGGGCTGGSQGSAGTLSATGGNSYVPAPGVASIYSNGSSPGMGGGMSMSGGPGLIVVEW